MATVELTRDNCHHAVNGSDTVVGFWAPRCARCRAFAPTCMAATGQA